MSNRVPRRNPSSASVAFRVSWVTHGPSGPAVMPATCTRRARGFWIVVGWSLFPFVPTDIVCYVAGTLRMQLGKFMLGVTIGEIPIVAFYVAGGTWLFS